MTFADALTSLVSGGVIALFGGLARELISTHRYKIEMQAQQQRDQLIAQHPEAAEAIRKEPLPKAPSLGPLAVMLALAGTTGAAAGPMVRPAMDGLAAAGECRKDKDCGTGCSCSGGQCKCAALERKPPSKPEPTASLRWYAGDTYWKP